MTLEITGGFSMFSAARWRNRRELDRWLRGHRARLVRLAWSWCGDPVLADDLVQEAYARAVKSSHTLRDARAAHAWMIRIMHRVYLDHLKSGGRRERPVDFSGDDRFAGTLSDGGETPEGAAAGRQRERRVREAVASLPPGQRQVLTLVDLEEMSYAECAATLQIPVGTVMSRLSRARTALRERLTGAFESTPVAAAALRRVK